MHRAPGVTPAPFCYGSLAPGTAPDTLRGIISLNGSEPGLLVMLTPVHGHPVELLIDRRLATATVGGEVSSYGSIRQVEGSEQMSVTRLVARALGADMAYDGILVRGPDGDQLLTCDGPPVRLGRSPVPIPAVSGDRIVVVNPTFPTVITKLPEGLP